MEILFFSLAAVLFHIIVCVLLNSVSEESPRFPKNIIHTDKLGTAVSAAGAAISCAALYIHFEKAGAVKLPILYILCIGLAVATVTDIKKNIISNRLVLVLLCAWGAYLAIYMMIDFQAGLLSLIGSVTGALFSLLVFGTGYLIMKNKLGGGDVKLTFVMGLILTGDAIFGALIYGMGLSLLFAAGALISGKMKMKDTMPFAPFLFLGTAAAIAVM